MARLKVVFWKLVSKCLVDCSLLLGTNEIRLPKDCPTYNQMCNSKNIIYAHAAKIADIQMYFAVDGESC